MLSKSNHSEKLVVSLTISTSGIFCQRLLRMLKKYLKVIATTMFFRNLKKMKSNLNMDIDMYSQIQRRKFKIE